MNKLSDSKHKQELINKLSSDIDKENEEDEQAIIDQAAA